MSSTSSAHEALPKTSMRLQGSARTSKGFFTRAIREPLVHFVVAGFVLFVAYALLHPERFAAGTSRRIELSATDVGRVELAFIARWQRPPTPTELRGLLASEVRNEILSREAIALGLDKDDVIVKRRLAQKMEFLADDMSALPDPTPVELRAWFDLHRSEFAPASRITFRHVFFSTDQRGAGAEGAARKALTSASDRRAAVPRGDPFMFQDYYAAQTQLQVAQVFGSDFAKTVFSSETQRWSGPFSSGLGWHLVWAEELNRGEVPSYEDVEAEVRERWMFAQRDAAKRAGFEAMLARYEVVLPSKEAVDLAMASRLGASTK
jgi:peptidyl-prolyl cis-trans isomerase C